MRMHDAARRVLIVAAPLLTAATVAWIPGATAAARTAPAASAGFFTAQGVLIDVAATSAQNAWAVGRTSSALASRTLIARWNGTGWKVVPSPASARRGWLDGVAVTSARNAWAVGFTTPGTGGGRTLILHWNGISWTRVPSPSPGSGAQLIGVAATSARNAWAVGDTGGSKSLIVHWNGTSWTRVPSPSPGSGTILIGVAATSARNAWAVGYTLPGTLPGSKTVILRWNGTAWTRVPSPSLQADSNLNHVAATSARNAWAVGCTGCTGSEPKALILRWNGAAWTRVPSPSRRADELYGVAATSARNAWAVGATGATASSTPKTLILRWNGTAWKRVASPTPAGGAGLFGVAATAARNAWAVGVTGNLFAGKAKALVLRWNGTAWK